MPASGCASVMLKVLGWALIVIAVIGGIKNLGGDPVETALTVILMIGLGIGLIRRSPKLIGITFCLVLGLIVFMVALPKSNRARMFSQEMTALSSIRTIQTAQQQYYSKYGKYATSLTELGPLTAGAGGPAAADLIDSTLASGEKGGYKFTLSPNADGYMINANPVAFGVSGSRTFYSDQTMGIRQNTGAEPATSNSEGLK